VRVPAATLVLLLACGASAPRPAKPPERKVPFARACMVSCARQYGEERPTQELADCYSECILDLKPGAWVALACTSEMPKFCCNDDVGCTDTPGKRVQWVKRSGK
jgi:hypothetical protein